MTYLVDTDVLSRLLRGDGTQALMQRLAATPLSQQATTSISVGELHFGARRLGPVPRAALLVERIERLLPEWILPFDAEAARAYGQIRAGLEARGTPIGDADTRIAAIALVHGMTVVTGNVRHFERVPGLEVENWLV